ncbi:hypothetical protein MHLP_01765 [Candidatus Mycoplasma haematolamae str. Purdue]|uniref:Uncharacterized protein n=1 Tax=Mycoplasma haematolamae (strain Purdue) TaxID=1212765 RepID=I7BJD2_MYCHA|nr:hypothetical protein [Candidatus Mycoplasma haematolamae]AFO51933.1 hypothetical protein MHLP_01765 [Candidatus Mycoplasma haematolamae str. Purdue]
MSKIPLIFSGLGVGTAVTGGTHFVKNVQPSLDKPALIRQLPIGSIEKDRKPTVEAAPKKQKDEVIQEVDGHPESSEQEDLAPEKGLLEQEGPEATADKPVGPRPLVEESRQQVQDIFEVSPVKPPVYRKGQLKQGSPSRPDIVCVAEETDEKDYDYKGLASNKYRFSCIKKNNDSDYEKSLKSQTCSLDINKNLNSDLHEKLINPNGRLCRYWDSYVGTNNRSLTFSTDQIPEDFR